MKDFEKHVIDYLEYLTVRNYSKRTIEEYHYELNYFLRWLKEMDITGLSLISHTELFKYQNHINCVKSKNSGKKLSTSTQAKKLTVIKEFLKYLVKTNILFSNPACKLKLPSPHETIKWHILSVRKVKRILQTPDMSTPIGYRDRTILEVLYTTGMRASELCALTTRSINYEDNIIHIKLGKGAKSRYVPANSRSVSFVSYYVKNIRNLLLGTESGRYLFISKNGRPFKKNLLRYMVATTAAKSGIRKAVSPQCFRIACATHMLKNGADIRYIQQLLGHAHIDTTMKYLKLEKSELKKIHTRSHPREQTAALWK